MFCSARVSAPSLRRWLAADRAGFWRDSFCQTWMDSNLFVFFFWQATRIDNPRVAPDSIRLQISYAFFRLKKKTLPLSRSRMLPSAIGYSICLNIEDIGNIDLIHTL